MDLLQRGFKLLSAMEGWRIGIIYADWYLLNMIKTNTPIS
jgi:hypothetical protein